MNSDSPFFHEERAASLRQFADRPITVGGLGALGGNLAETLARMGFHRLKLIDRDRVEMRNLSTQPYERRAVGAPKARVLAHQLYRAVQTWAEPLIVELNPSNAGQLLAGSALVIDAFDNSAARAAVSAEARRSSLPCLHVGFSADGQYGCGIWEPGYPVPRETPADPCNDPPVRPFVLVLVSLAARAVVEHFATHRRLAFELTWMDLKITWRDSDLP